MGKSTDLQIGGHYILSRLVVTFELSVILLAMLMHVRSEYVFYMSMGITVNAISMIVAKLSGQEVTTHEGKD